MLGLPQYASIDRSNTANNNSQMALQYQTSSHAQLQTPRNSSSPVQRQIHQPGYLLETPSSLSSHQQLPLNPSCRAMSPAPSINSEGNHRYNNPSFQTRQPTLMGSIPSSRLSPVGTFPITSFHQQHPNSAQIEGEMNVNGTSLKRNPLRKNLNDCRVTVNPVANYAICENEDPQSWAPLLKAAQQESSL